MRRMTPETESETAFPRNTLRFSQLNLNLEIDTLAEYTVIESRQKHGEKLSSVLYCSANLYERKPLGRLGRPYLPPPSRTVVPRWIGKGQGGLVGG